MIVFNKLIIMEKINNYWVDSNGNKWLSSTNSKEQAEEYSSSLISCKDCIDCIDCRGCTGCTDCTNCKDCRGCSYCSDCINCTDCSDCINCTDCSDCRSCSDFTENPERIVSKKIGSRKSSTTYYWTKEHEQIICGCFSGTLQQFEDRVKEVHKDTIYVTEYLNWIARVKLYKDFNKS